MANWQGNKLIVRGHIICTIEPDGQGYCRVVTPSGRVLANRLSESVARQVAEAHARSKRIAPPQGAS